MEIISRAKYLKTSVYKARKVADLIRGRLVSQAVSILEASPRKASRIIRKVLESAISAAKNRGDIDVDNLYVKRIYCDQGPVIKRTRPMSRGRAGMIRKRSAHITVILDEK